MANFWKEPHRLLDDEQKTLKQQRIIDGNTLFLENGIAIPGQITLTFDQYVITAHGSYAKLVGFDGFRSG